MADDAITDGAEAYVHRHCHFAAWVRASAKTLGEATTLEGIRIIVDSTIPLQHYLFGANGIQDSGAVCPQANVTPCYIDQNQDTV